MPPRLDIPTLTGARIYMQATAEALAETLWPTRCAICDTPGELLCTPCRLHLPYVDYWRACPYCGAPYGRIQCTECNSIMLKSMDRERLPYDACASAVSYNDNVARVVRTWKDAKEQRLVEVMARLMTPVVPPTWLDREPPLVTYIPATTAALRTRGFDHGEALASHVAKTLNLPCAPTLARPRAKDQRSLIGRQQRHRNTVGSFAVLQGVNIPPSLLLIDDVCTTGSTLFAACDTLREAGARHIRCLTFARV